MYLSTLLEILGCVSMRDGVIGRACRDRKKLRPLD